MVEMSAALSFASLRSSVPFALTLMPISASLSAFAAVALIMFVTYAVWLVRVEPFAAVTTLL